MRPPALALLGLAIAGVAAAALLLLGITWGARALHNLRDRHEGYEVDLRIEAGSPGPLSAGFAAVAITPTVADSWTDENGNARFDPDEPWRDGNANGRFDPVWLAGFHGRRAAQGVHDDLWARAIVLDDGRARIAVVVLDAIGLMHDQVVDIRSRLTTALELDYVVVTSTHTHQAPDLMGLWGESETRSGVDPDYLEQVVAGAARAVAEAVTNQRRAVLRFLEIPDAAAELVTDTRLPRVLDAAVLVLQALDATSGETLGTFVSWGNHPETVWSQNLWVSSDFPHSLRNAIEGGVRSGDRVVRAGLGGVCVYASAAIGGLMTTSPDVMVRNPVTDREVQKPSFEKARAQGERLALLVLEGLRGTDVHEVRQASIALRARTLELALDNRLLLLAAAMGVLPRGFTSFETTRTEVAAWRIGPASFIAVPGEIYPEIVNGGIEAPHGQDFPIAPVETPPLRELMPGRFRFVLGLANDALGYIIPKSQWDDEAPWLYGAEEETYGEVVSAGPETAPTLHRALREALSELDSDPGEISSTR